MARPPRPKGAGYVWHPERREWIRLGRDGGKYVPPRGYTLARNDNGKLVLRPDKDSRPNPNPVGTGDGSNSVDPPADTRPPKPQVPGMDFYWSGTEWVGYPLPGYVSPEEQAERDLREAQRQAQQQSAYETLQSWFVEFGIDDEMSGQESLSSKIWGWISGDKSADWIKLELRKTDQYRARFPGMEAISKKGMAMSEAEYIATERAYFQVLSTAGLDSVYGNRADYGRFIANEVSAQELASRVQIAKDYVNMYAPASVKQQLRELYGMDDTQMAAYVLDTSEGKRKSLAALESEYTKRQSQAQVGGAAIDTGLGISTPLRDQIAEAGYNYNQAMAGLGRAKTEADAYRRLGGLYGEATSTDELVQENFGLGGGAEATTKKKKLASRERAAFSGSSALSAGSLAANRIGQV